MDATNTTKRGTTMRAKLIYKYRGTEYPTRYEANQAASDEAKARGRPVSEERQMIHKVRRTPNQQDTELS